MRHTYTKCKDCKWWSPLSERGPQSQRGECRRYPPSVFFSGRVYETFCEVSQHGFPVTSEDWWCGEAHF